MGYGRAEVCLGKSLQDSKSRTLPQQMHLAFTENVCPKLEYRVYSTLSSKVTHGDN